MVFNAVPSIKNGNDGKILAVLVDNNCTNTLYTLKNCLRDKNLNWRVMAMMISIKGGLWAFNIIGVKRSF